MIRVRIWEIGGAPIEVSDLLSEVTIHYYAYTD
jgi:hypothetical protein